MNSDMDHLRATACEAVSRRMPLGLPVEPEVYRMSAQPLLLRRKKTQMKAPRPRSPTEKRLSYENQLLFGAQRRGSNFPKGEDTLRERKSAQAMTKTSFLPMKSMRFWEKRRESVAMMIALMIFPSTQVAVSHRMVGIILVAMVYGEGVYLYFILW